MPIPGPVFAQRETSGSSIIRYANSAGNSRCTSCSNRIDNSATDTRARLINLEQVVQCASRQLAPMARVTQPSRLTMQPITSSTKVRRERGGTAARRKEIHSKSCKQTEADKDMRERRRSEGIPHWPPRSSLQNQPQASNAAALPIDRHVKCFMHFLRQFLALLACLLHR